MEIFESVTIVRDTLAGETLFSFFFKSNFGNSFKGIFDNLCRSKKKERDHERLVERKLLLLRRGTTDSSRTSRRP